KLEADAPLEPVYNLGSGDGVSVRQIMDAVAKVTGIEFSALEEARRPGDPARIVADGTLAARDLDWKMRHSLEQMVHSAWKASARRCRTRHEPDASGPCLGLGAQPCGDLIH